jgi:Holliday junction resolvase
MAATPEKKVKDKVVSILKAEGAYYFFPMTHGYGRSGVPDIVACVNGWFLGIECKAGKNKVSEHQAREIQSIRAANGVAVVVNEENWDMLPELIRKLKALKGAE